MSDVVRERDRQINTDVLLTPAVAACLSVVSLVSIVFLLAIQDRSGLDGLIVPGALGQDVGELQSIRAKSSCRTFSYI